MSAALAKHAPRLAVLGGLVAAVVLAATQFPAAGNDDSHITYWAAHALAHYGTFVNYNGAHVEQSSSLTLVVLLAVLHLLVRAPLPAVAWALSIAAGVGTVLVSTRLARRVERESALWVPLLVGTSLPVVYWATSGMEATLTALLAFAFVDLLGNSLDENAFPRAGRAVGAGAVTLLFAGVRPETPVALLGVLVATAALHGLEAWRRPSPDARGRALLTLKWLALGAGAVALVTASRWWLFHALLPNSAAAKVGGFELSPGMRYFWRGLSKTDVLLAPIALAGALGAGVDLAAGRASGRTAPLLAMTLALSGFVLASGGDWMPAGRFVAPLLPGICIFAALLVARVARSSAAGAVALGSLLVLLNIRGAVAFGASNENGSYSGQEAWQGEAALVGPAKPAFQFTELGNKAHRRDARLLGVMLDVVARLHPSPEHPLYVMSGQAGMVPYYLFSDHYGALKFIDLFAITTRDILPCMPDAKRRSGIHGIRLDPVYIIEEADSMPAHCNVKRPDLVFSTGRFPSYLAQHGYERIYQGPRDMEAYVAIDRRLRSTLGERGSQNHTAGGSSEAEPAPAQE